MKPLEPWFKAIDGVKDPASLTKLLGRFRRNSAAASSSTSARRRDYSDANQVLGQLWQAGLGMPSASTDLDAKPKFAELQSTRHVAAMLMLAGDKEDKAKAGAKKVMELETRLAKTSMTKEDLRKPKMYAHRTVKAELGRTAAGVQWDAWLDGAKVKGREAVQRGTADFMKEVGVMRSPRCQSRTEDLPPLAPAPHPRQRALSASSSTKFKVAPRAHGRRTISPMRWKRCIHNRRRRDGRGAGAAVREEDARHRGQGQRGRHGAGDRRSCTRTSSRSRGWTSRRRRRPSRNSPRSAKQDRLPWTSGATTRSSRSFAATMCRTHRRRAPSVRAPGVQMDKPVDRSEVADEPADGERVLRRAAQRDGVPRRHPSAAVHSNSTPRRDELRRHRHGHGPRAHARLSTTRAASSTPKAT